MFTKTSYKVAVAHSHIMTKKSDHVILKQLPYLFSAIS